MARSPRRLRQIRPLVRKHRPGVLDSALCLEVDDDLPVHVAPRLKLDRIADLLDREACRALRLRRWGTRLRVENGVLVALRHQSPGRGAATATTVRQMEVVIAGGTGALGRRLSADLAAHGHEVVILTRNPRPGAHRHVAWDGRTLGAWVDELS